MRLRIRLNRSSLKRASAARRFDESRPVEQFEAILADVRNQPRNHLREETGDFLEFLGLAGVGQAEAGSFTWRDDRGEKLRFVRQKTGKEFFVPVYAWLAPLMAKLRARRGNAKDEARVFTIAESRVPRDE